jgi:FSR family fosmidomycin resistance protein-like MFS transporter
MADSRRLLTLLAGSHVSNDLYQGVIPASLPFFVLDRGFSYAAASGLVLAATLASSVLQPLFGFLADRRPLTGLISGGLALGAIGAGLSGLAPSYALVWLSVALSGVGVAAFHPEAARAARAAAGDSATGMSVFAVGGNFGFALAPLIVTPLLAAYALHATVFLAIPGLVMAGVTLTRMRSITESTRAAGLAGGAKKAGGDMWPAFLRLTVLEIVRSAVFFGLAAYVALYWTTHFGASTAVAGAALTVFLAGGAVGTLFGGWAADRIGRVATIRLGYLLLPFVVVAMRVTPEVPAFACALLAGAAAYLPFTVLVTLGQDYLPNRIGTASGVTLGLAVSAGGLVNPLFGIVADAHGPATVIWVIAPLPILAFAIALTLPTLAKDRRPGSIWTQVTGRGRTTVTTLPAEQEPSDSPVPTDR